MNAAINQAVQSASGYEIEFRSPWPNGEIHWIAGTGKVFLGEDGKPARMLGVGMDATKHKRAEQTARFLADASAELAVLLDVDSTLQKLASLAVPYFADWAAVDCVQKDGTVRRVAVAHIDPSKVELAQDLQRRFPPDPASGTGVWNVLRTGQHITDDLLLQSIDSEELLDAIRDLGLKSYIAVPIKVRGKALGVISFFSAEAGHLYDESDLSVAEDLASRAAIAIENSELYRELHEADRHKDEFLATLAHELRNPLAPVKNSLELMKRSSSDPATIESARSTMDRQIGHLVRLVDDLLDVSQITRNKLELKKERVELASVVDHAAETCRPLCEQDGHTLQISLPPEPIFLEADPTRLAQIFGNLLTNSCKFTPAGGRISLTAEVHGSHVEVRVKDNGVGIPPEMLPKIFELFTQVDRSLERAESGLGIGLSLVKRLVEMHDGTVTAYSEGNNAGSEFVVVLPILASEQPIASTPETSAIPSSRGMRILVVDDNRDSSDTLALLLQLSGYVTRTAHDGLEAVSAAADFDPDLILLDIGLPGMNGYEACRTIRERPRGKDVAIVALTGWGQDEDRRMSEEAGFDGHIVKPVDIVDLESLIGDTIKKRAARSGRVGHPAGREATDSQ